MKMRGSYVTYSLGSAIAWAIVLGICAATVSSHDMGYILCMFYGWFICWISGTLARYVYRPPSKWMPRDTGVESASK